MTLCLCGREAGRKRPALPKPQPERAVLRDGTCKARAADEAAATAAAGCKPRRRETRQPRQKPGGNAAEPETGRQHPAKSEPTWRLFGGSAEARAGRLKEPPRGRAEAQADAIRGGRSGKPPMGSPGSRQRRTVQGLAPCRGAGEGAGAQAPTAARTARGRTSAARRSGRSRDSGGRWRHRPPFPFVRGSGSSPSPGGMGTQPAATSPPISSAKKLSCARRRSSSSASKPVSTARLFGAVIRQNRDWPPVSRLRQPVVPIRSK